MTQIAVQVFYCPEHGPVTKQTTAIRFPTRGRVCLVAVEWEREDDRESIVYVYRECDEPVSGPHVLTSMTKP